MPPARGVDAISNSKGHASHDGAGFSVSLRAIALSLPTHAYFVVRLSREFSWPVGLLFANALFLRHVLSIAIASAYSGRPAPPRPRISQPRNEISNSATLHAMV